MLGEIILNYINKNNLSIEDIANELNVYVDDLLSSLTRDHFNDRISPIYIARAIGVELPQIIKGSNKKDWIIISINHKDEGIKDYDEETFTRYYDEILDAIILHYKYDNLILRKGDFICHDDGLYKVSRVIIYTISFGIRQLTYLLKDS